MPRARLAGIVTRQSEVEGKPSHSVELRCGEVYIFRLIQSFGRRGITCGDFKGDLRHYIRNFKNKGIGLREEWETDEFGQHKRWWLKDGQSFREIPYVSKKKKPAAGSERALNSNIPNGNLGGLNEGEA